MKIFLSGASLCLGFILSLVCAGRVILEDIGIKSGVMTSVDVIFLTGALVFIGFGLYLYKKKD